MKHTAAHIYAEQSVAGVQREIASIGEVFRILDVEELEQANSKYMVDLGNSDRDTMVKLSSAMAEQRTKTRPYIDASVVEPSESRPV